MSELKKAEAALRASEEKFSKAFHADPDAIIITRLGDGHILEINEGFVGLFGYTPEEAVGKTVLDLNIYANPADHHQIVNELRSNARVEGREVEIHRRGASRGVALLTAERIELQGEPCAVAVARDITERLQLEERIRQAQKMESVGRLAVGIAHDFNNLLTVINGYADMLLHAPALNDEDRGLAHQILDAGNRAAGLTHQLLAFSRKQVLRPGVLSLNSVVNDTTKMLERLLREDVQLLCKLEATANVLADPAQMQQVLMNLALNARDAMPAGGKLTIRTADVTVEDNQRDSDPELPPGEYVQLSVSDTGQGMSEEVKAHLFEPFFTTKGMGNGTGLGLSTVYGIVKQSGGHIRVYSEPGLGTTFRIYLPPVGEAETPRQATARTVYERGTETILLVEDQPQVLKLAAQVLENQGYAVLQAKTAQEALAICSAVTSSPHLVLTDVVLPDMTGPRLVEQLKARHPDTRVLYMSGYTNDVVVQHGLLAGDISYVQKPFTLPGLLGKVREALDS